MFFNPESMYVYLNSGILFALLVMVVFFLRCPALACFSPTGDLTGTGLIIFSDGLSRCASYLVRDLERLGAYFSCVFFLMACSSSCKMLNFLNWECDDIQ